MIRKSPTSEVIGVELEPIEFETEEVKYKGTVLVNQEKDKNKKPEDRIKHGQGVLLDVLDGTRYEGQFSLNRKHGQGKLEYEATGDCYEG